MCSSIARAWRWMFPMVDDTVLLELLVAQVVAWKSLLEVIAGLLGPSVASTGEMKLAPVVETGL